MNKYDHLSVSELEAMLQEQMDMLRTNIELLKANDRERYSTLEQEMAALLQNAGLTSRDGRRAKNEDPLAELGKLIGQTNPFALDHSHPAQEQECDVPPECRVRRFLSWLRCNSRWSPP